MTKTLVIILAETRAYERTYENIRENLIQRLDADLCICVGVKSDYNYDNPFFLNAKYRFLYEEPDDFASAFDYAYNELTQEKHDNQSTDVKRYTSNITVYQGQNQHRCQNLNGYQLPWRDFLNVHEGDQFMGGILDSTYQQPGSAGILIFFRWFLLKNLLENDLINQYDRFIITRSDYIYTLPHIQMNILDEEYIWIPDTEDHGGYTDRHTVLSKQNIVQYLNILNCFVLDSNNYFNAMKTSDLTFNLETLIKFHLTYHNLHQNVRRIPYVMYTIRLENGTSRWAKGNWSEEHKFYIKYETEYIYAKIYKERFDDFKLFIDSYYEFVLPYIQDHDK